MRRPGDNYPKSAFEHFSRAHASCTDNFFPRPINGSSRFSFLPTKLTAAVYKETTGADEGEDSRSPCPMPETPVAHAIND